MCNGVLLGDGNVESLEDCPVAAHHWLVLLHPQQACNAYHQLVVSEYIILEL